MEMDSLHPPDHTEAAEPGPSSKDAQVWKELKAETGFASYADYLKFYMDIRPDFSWLLDEFGDLPKVGHATERPSIVIFDLSKRDNLPLSLSSRYQFHSGTELIQALRKPPDHVCVQLVLWFCSFKQLDQEMASALVLGLKLDPEILKEVAYLGKIEARLLRPKRFRTSHIKSVVGNGTIAAISQNFKPGVADAVPVLLVASDSDFGLMDGFYDNLAKSDLTIPPIQALGDSTVFDLDIRTFYARSVEQFSVEFGSATSSKAFQLLAATSPLLYGEAYRVREVSEDVRHGYISLTSKRLPRVDTFYTEENLEIGRLQLRRTLEEAEDHVNQIFRYLGSEVDTDWSKEPSYVGIKADWVSLIGEARRLETEVRDYMQLVVGNLSLEESRRSIELSNLQIREAQSVKLFTILAFIYVPLNLATSIFGMNIQQLNKSGQNLWVFFVTAVVALLVTGGSWLWSKSIYKAMLWYKLWYKQRPASHSTRNTRTQRREYGLLLRMAMLVWLVRDGHSYWMWNSGAWLAILIGSEVEGDAEDPGKRQPACDYVSENSQRSEGERDRYFEVGSDTSITWSPLSGFLSKFSKPENPERDSSETSA